MGKFDAKSNEQDGASAGKIFIGGLHKETTLAMFTKHFGEYGEIVDSVIMKDRNTQQPRGFGFITYADPAVVDKVIEGNHVINGKQVEIKRTIPKGTSQSKDIKTKKIFVGGIPTTMADDELKDFFSQYGKVVEHQIIRDHESKRSRGFGFIIFDSEEVVDELLRKGNMLDMAGGQVEIKKAEPKKSSNPPPFARESRGNNFDEGYGGFGPYGGVSAGAYRSAGLGGRPGDYGGYGRGVGDLGGGYGAGPYGGESSLGYSSRLGSYGGGFGAYGAGSIGGYGREEGLGSYVGSRYAGGYESGGSAGYRSGAGSGYGAGAGAGVGAAAAYDTGAGYGPGAGADYGSGAGAPYSSGAGAAYGSGGMYGAGRGGGAGYAGGSARYHPYGR